MTLTDVEKCREGEACWSYREVLAQVDPKTRATARATKVIISRGGLPFAGLLRGTDLTFMDSAR